MKVFRRHKLGDHFSISGKEVCLTLSSYFRFRFQGSKKVAFNVLILESVEFTLFELLLVPNQAFIRRIYFKLIRV